MTPKIGLCGVYGSGKTTKAKELSDHYANLGNMVLVVDKVARSCPHPLRTIEAQEWIWYEQMVQEKDAMAQDVDVIICDRTAMDNLMYYRDVILSINRGSLVRWYGLDANLHAGYPAPPKSRMATGRRSDTTEGRGVCAADRYAV